jgi:hypothetical protein
LNHPAPEADTEPMESRVRVLRELVQKSLYVVDERAVADAIILRAQTRVLLPEPTSGEASRGRQGRSFRRDRDAPSFRLTSGRRRRVSH